MATKTFPHAVIFNGKFYPPHTPIKVEEDKKPEVKSESAQPTQKKAVVKNDRRTGKKS